MESECADALALSARAIQASVGLSPNTLRKDVPHHSESCSFESNSPDLYRVGESPKRKKISAQIGPLTNSLTAHGKRFNADSIGFFVSAPGASRPRSGPLERAGDDVFQVARQGLLGRDAPQRRL